MMLKWDVLNGVARRCWSGNEYARETMERSMAAVNGLIVTMPSTIMDQLEVDEAMMNGLV